MEDVKVVCKSAPGTTMGPVWFIGWLFTIGYLELHFWKGLLAIVVWPYLLGSNPSLEHLRPHTGPTMLF